MQQHFEREPRLATLRRLVRKNKLFSCQSFHVSLNFASLQAAAVSSRQERHARSPCHARSKANIQVNHLLSLISLEGAIVDVASSGCLEDCSPLLGGSIAVKGRQDNVPCFKQSNMSFYSS